VLGAIARSALGFARVPPGREAAIKVELAALVVTGRPTFAMAERGDGPRARTAASFIPVGGDSMAALLDWNATEGLSEGVSSSRAPAPERTSRTSAPHASASRRGARPGGELPL
jgi:hypothetical protein